MGKLHDMAEKTKGAPAKGKPAAKKATAKPAGNSKMKQFAAFTNKKAK